MKRLLVAIPVLAALALPGAVQADGNKTDKTNAARECKAERGTTAATREAFRVRYGTNANGRNAFGKCVSKRARAIAKRRSAAKTCAAERKADPAAFKAKYGTNRNKANAFGKCVSAAVRKKATA